MRTELNKEIKLRLESFKAHDYAILAIALICSLNVLYFLGQSSSPHIRDDAWYLLENFISKWIESGFDFSDLFVKRQLTDHAQPIYKIILFLNLKLLALDFRVEAIIGYLALACIAVFLVATWRRCINFSEAKISSKLMLLCAILMLFTLNSTEIYTWPLVTFGYVYLLGALIIAQLIFHYLNEGGVVKAIVLVVLILALIGDSASVLVVTSIVTTLLIYMIHSDLTFRLRSKYLIISLLIVLAIGFIVINWKFLGFGSTTDLARTSQYDLSSFVTIMEVIRIVLSSAILNGSYVAGFGSMGYAITVVFAVVMFVLIGRHFYMVLFNRWSDFRQHFIQSFILIYAFVSITAIVIGRVPDYGVNYLHQPRYFIIYMLLPVAIFMDYAVELQNDSYRFRLISKVLPLITLLVLVMQVYVSVNAHRSTPYISRFWNKQIEEFNWNILNVEGLPRECNVYNSSYCGYSVEKRMKLFGVLADNKLNIFNDNFQWRYRMHLVNNGLIAPRVVKWGPTVIEASPVSQGIWVKFNKPIKDSYSRIAVNFNNVEVDTVVDGLVLTFGVPLIFSNVPGEYRFEMTDFVNKKPIFSGFIRIK